jgi:hypothetical protein
MEYSLQVDAETEEEALDIFFTMSLEQRHNYRVSCEFEATEVLQNNEELK